MFADGRLAFSLGFDVHDFLAPAGKDFVEVIGGAMKFLRADDQIHVGQCLDEFLAAALRHAAHVAENLAGPVFLRGADEVLHLVDGLLLGEIAHAAGVEQNHVGDGLGLRQRITLGDELRGDSLAVALVHLASVGFDIDARHDATNRAEITPRWTG